MTSSSNNNQDNCAKETYTKRATSPALENILGEPIKLLDHGFIRVVDYMGNDTSITQAARVSYGKGTKTTQNDKALIKYLMRHLHTSPFEMCEIKLHIKAPIFVIRQWIRHRTANVNEYSGRYSLMIPEFYVPESDQLQGQSQSNKQGRVETLAEPLNSCARDIIKNLAEQNFQKYKELLNLDKESLNVEDERGISRELARIVLPLNTYTELYWKIDLHNLLHFIALRVTDNAQYEIRVYAQALLDIVKKWVPMVAESFINYRQQGVKLSKEGARVIQDLLTKGSAKKSDYDLSKREWLELAEHFDLGKVEG